MKSTGSRDRGRFLLVTWDGAGNLPPERSLIRELMARGHRVDVLAHTSVRERFEADGARFHEYRSLKSLSSADRIDPRVEMQHTLDHVVFAQGVGDDMRLLLEAIDPQVLLIDGMLAYGLLAARVAGLPTVALWHSLYSLVKGGAFQEVFDSQRDEINRVAAASGLALFPSYRSLLEADQVLVFAYGSGFDDASGLPPNVFHVGPLRSVDPEATGEHLRSSKGPLVVVGLSTSYMDQKALLQRLCDALAEMPVEALVTTGPAVPPESLTTGPNTTAVEFIAHDRVLPSARLLVTHAGHGTVAAGLTYGVPMLCIPMGRDQPLVAARVAELQLGGIANPEASVEELRAAMTRLMVDEKMSQRAQEFAVRAGTHAGRVEAIQVAENALGSA